MFLKPKTTINRFSDIKLGFDKNPYTKDVSRVYNENAIRQSIVNLVLTKQGEIPFKPWKGTKIMSLLFENHSPIIEHEIKKEIEYALEQEPRVRLQNVEIYYDENSNAYKIKITYLIVNTNKESSVQIMLKRTR